MLRFSILAGSLLCAATALGRGRAGLNSESRVVLARDRNFGEWLDSLFHAFHVLRFDEHLLLLRAARDDAREREEGDGHGHQDADDEAENVEKMSILFAHDCIRGKGPKSAAKCIIAAPERGSVPAFWPGFDKENTASAD